MAAVDVKNRFSVGDSVEMMTPQGNVHFVIKEMRNRKGKPLT